MRARSGSFVLLLAMLAGGAAAQTESPPRADWNPVRAIPGGRKVEVRLEDGRRFVGKVLRADDGAIMVRSKGQEHELRRDQVASVAPVRRTYKKSILWGAAIGAGFLGTTGAVGTRHEEQCFLCFFNFTKAEALGIGAGLGAVLGTATGAVVGRFRHNRTPLYELTPRGGAPVTELFRGRKEIRLIGGFGQRSGGPVGVSGGVEASVGLNRHVALTAGYFHSRLGTENTRIHRCLWGCSPRSSVQTTRPRADELMGGVRISIPRKGRIAPYGTLSGGALRAAETVRNSFPASSTSSVRTVFGAGLGIGVNCEMSSRAGVSGEVRGVVPFRGSGWYLRSSGGIYFRF